MFEWWASLTLLERVFAYLAVPATVVLVVQTVLTLFGLFDGGGEDGDLADITVDPAEPELDFDADLNSDFDPSLDPDLDVDADPETGEAVGAFRLVTIRGMVAFLAVGGWTGLSLSRIGVGPVWSILAALGAGLAAMVLIAGVLFGLTRMNSSGTLDYRNAIGAVGEVYLTIPVSGRGKIQVIIQDALREAEARQEGKTPLTTGTPVTVVAADRDGTLVVRSLQE